MHVALAMDNSDWGPPCAKVVCRSEFSRQMCACTFTLEASLNMRYSSSWSQAFLLFHPMTLCWLLNMKKKGYTWSTVKYDFTICKWFCKAGSQNVFMRGMMPALRMEQMWMNLKGILKTEPVDHVHWHCPCRKTMSSSLLFDWIIWNFNICSWWEMTYYDENWSALLNFSKRASLQNSVPDLKSWTGTSWILWVLVELFGKPGALKGQFASQQTCSWMQFCLLLEIICFSMKYLEKLLHLHGSAYGEPLHSSWWRTVMSYPHLVSWHGSHQSSLLFILLPLTCQTCLCPQWQLFAWLLLMS